MRSAIKSSTGAIAMRCPSRISTSRISRLIASAVEKTPADDLDAHFEVWVIKAAKQAAVPLFADEAAVQQDRFKSILRFCDNVEVARDDSASRVELDRCAADEHGSRLAFSNQPFEGGRQKPQRLNELLAIRHLPGFYHSAGRARRSGRRLLQARRNRRNREDLAIVAS